ncbi:uncharacterized protein LOC110010585 isoform X2 [Jatropha curcas]|uniref:uncharacterized protein LOC110010585 isoform X2 n=1 Tax=Jatropha curcas TaxID=180498 RepID=UPI001895E6D5|nr:uncharacterized protein LOC110010585 isoform X2 [Jatropha curcas]
MFVLHLMELRRSLQILFRLDDELVIEKVVIPCDRGKTTVCVLKSSGLCHELSVVLHWQVVFAERLVTSKVGSITNVVFMEKFKCSTQSFHLHHN